MTRRPMTMRPTSTQTTRRAGAARRGLSALAVAALTVSLAACGSDSDEASGRTPEAEVTMTAGSEGTTVDGLPTAEARLFAATSPWNTRVDGDAVDEESSRMINRAQFRVGVVEDATTVRTVPRRITDPLYINTESWTVPVVAGGEPTAVVCRQSQCGDGDDTVTLTIPADVDPDPRYDGWFTIVDVGANVAYDLWRARREDDDSISYHYMKKWALDGPGYQEPGSVGARGSGLPLFAAANTTDVPVAAVVGAGDATRERRANERPRVDRRSAALLPRAPERSG